LYCDVSLPVPLDQAFTYSLPETLNHRIQCGCRVLVPFGNRKLTGVVLSVQEEPPDGPTREVLRLIDEVPVLDSTLLALGRWIAGYYCAPLGEVLRTMTPLGGEIRKGKMYTLTDSGRDAARQLLLGAVDEDPMIQLLRLLDARPVSETYLKKKIPNAANLLRSLQKKGFVEAEDVQTDRDPMRAAAARLRATFVSAVINGMKLTKAERELHAFLELHPGSHNVGELEEKVKNASPSARSLARKKLITLETENPVTHLEPARPPRTLNMHQLDAYQQIELALRQQEYQTFLLHGVTGSGKTEVYLRAIDACLALGKSALLLVPEIALTPAVAGQFFHRFGDRVAILHSAFSEIERAEQWRRIRAGAARVVVGTRSGVFAPVQNLGLVVVDEEHDGSYKQAETPRYNGRDVAIVRAQAANAVVVLGSATPSLETRYNAEKGKFKLIELPERIEHRPMPQVEMIDMRQEFLETRKQAVFSRRMLEAIKERLASGEQVMLLLNRRGFSSFVACRTCGERIECVNCSVTLTYHRRDRRLLCHYCNYAQKIPSVCPKCNSEHLNFLGTGSEKVEDELRREFPEARIARLDRDTVGGKRHFETILHGFRERDFDILVGTQMIAKGHDIPNVTLVGVISADVGLGMPDFRAAERTFQLLTQAAGRAGRGNLPGIVLIQTINPDHYAVRYAGMQDYQGFYEKEIQFRKLMRYPPFSALANVLVRNQKQEDALAMSAELERFVSPPPEGLKILGPAEAPVAKLNSEFRYQVLIKAASRKKLNETLQSIRKQGIEKHWSATGLVIDVDPLTLL
jgi:primosomal protein N' (replication factor Y)